MKFGSVESGAGIELAGLPHNNRYSASLSRWKNFEELLQVTGGYGQVGRAVNAYSCILHGVKFWLRGSEV